MISNSKIVCHLKNFGMPVTADIFLTDFCNNKCPYCTYARYGERNGHYMSFDNFKIYAGKLLGLGVKGFILSGGGEPTINPDFTKITDWLQENNVSWGINTNFNVFRIMCPAYLKVSLDGWDEDSYQAVRGVRAYQKTVKNIIDFCDWKKQYSIKTNVGIQRVVTSPSDILSFYEANKKLPVDYIVFRPMESTLASAYEDNEVRDTVEMSIDIIKCLQRDDQRVKINYKWFELGTRFDSCVANWSQIAINTDGYVMYCCHKPYEIVCHITDKNVMQKKAEFSTDISRCDIPCRLTGPNKCLLEIDSISEPEFL